MPFVNGTSASNYTGTTFSASPAAAFACTAGNLICVAVNGWAPSGQTVSSVTDTAGNTYAKIGSVKYGNNVQVEYWFAYNITGHAANVVQANWSAPTAYWAICAIQRSGHPTTNPLGVSTTPYVQAAGVGFAISPIFSTSQANEAVVAFAHVDASSTTWSAGSIGPQAVTLQGAPLTLRTAVSGAQNVIQFQDGEYGAVLDNVSVIAINNNTANAKAIFVATFKTTAAPADFGTIPVRVTQDALTALASRAGEVGTLRVTQESLTALVDLGTPSATMRVSQTALTVLVSRTATAPLTVSVADSVSVSDAATLPSRLRQVLFGGSDLTAPSATRWLPLTQDFVTWNSTEANVASPWPAAGVFRNLIVSLSASPGGATSRTFTLRKNGADTGLTATVSGAATTARLTGVDVPVAVGDLLTLQHTLSGSPAGSTARWSVEFESSTAFESGYSAALGTAANSGSPRACGLFASAYALTTSLTAPTNLVNIVAAAGTLTRLIASVTLTGAGVGYTFYVNKNGVRQDGTGGTVNTACALIGVTSASASFALPLAAGDLVYVEAVATGTFSATGRVWSLGCSFMATAPCEYQVCGGGDAANTLSASVTDYGRAVGMAGTFPSTEVNHSSRYIGGVTSFRLSAFRVRLVTAPGASKSRTFDFRKNATSPGPTVTITDPATTGSDLTNTITVNDGDLWNIRAVPTASPAVTVVQWSTVGYVAPASSSAALSVSVGESCTVTDSATKATTPMVVQVADSSSVADATARSFVLTASKAAADSSAVTESARRQYPPRVRDDCIVRESVTAQLYALKVFLSLRETISVSESKQRAVTTSRMEVKVFDYIRTIDAKTAAIYGTVWDGSGTPPPPTPGVFDDYWLVGTGVGGINFAPGHLFRDGSYFNPLASWTVTLWARPHTDAPGPGAYRQEWFFGNASFIYLGSNFASNDVILEVSDGTSYFDSVTVPMPLGQWKHLAITHDAVTHALQLYVNDRLMGTMHYDLSTFAGDWGSTEEAGTMSWGNLELAQIRVWQDTLNQLEISAEARALSAVRKAGLLADTPIPTVDRRVDLSGHGHTWLGSGSLFTVTGPQATLDPVPRFPKGVVLIAAPSQVHSLGQPVTLNCPVISSDYTVERLADGRTDRVMRAAWETMAITIDCGEPCTPNLLGVLGHNIDHGRVIGVTNDAGLARGFGGRDPNCWIDLRGFPTTARYWTVFVNVNSVPVSMCEVVIATATVFEDGFWEGEFTEQVKYPGYRDQTEFLKTYLSASGAINRSASPNVRLSEEDRVKLAAITEEVMTTGGRVLVVPSSLINDIWYCEWPPLEELTYPNQRLRTLSLPLYEPPSSLVNGR